MAASNCETCLAPGEHYINKSQFCLDISDSLPDNFFKFVICLCVQVLLLL